MVGLGLIASGGGGELVLGDGLVALVEEVEHLAGVELGAFAKPITAVGLRGGGEVVGGGGVEVVLAAGGLSEAEEGHLETGIDEEVGFASVVDDLAVDGDGSGAVTLVLAEVGFFQAEEIVARVLAGEGALDGEGLGVAGVVAEEEGENGSGFDVVDKAVGTDVAKEIETFFLVAADAGDADHQADDAGQAGDGELLDADGHFGVGVVGIDPKGLLGVVAGLQTLMSGGDEGVVDEGDERRVEATGVATGEEGVLVGAIGLDLPVAEIGDLVGEGLDALADIVGHIDLALGGEKAVVSVVGGVEEVLVVELAKDEDLEHVRAGEGIVGVGAIDGLEAGEGAVVVEVIEVVVGFADLGKEVDGIGMGGGLLLGGGEGTRLQGRDEQKSKAGEQRTETRTGAGGKDDLQPLRLWTLDDGWEFCATASDSVNYRRKRWLGRHRGARFDPNGTSAVGRGTGTEPGVSLQTLVRGAAGARVVGTRGCGEPACD